MLHHRRVSVSQPGREFHAPARCVHCQRTQVSVTACDSSHHQPVLVLTEAVTNPHLFLQIGGGCVGGGTAWRSIVSWRGIMGSRTRNWILLSIMISSIGWEEVMARRGRRSEGARPGDHKGPPSPIPPSSLLAPSKLATFRQAPTPPSRASISAFGGGVRSSSKTRIMCSVGF
jgi:hypothetical protein